MIRKELTIGLFGFGCVGYGLYEVLGQTPGLQTTIKKVCVKHRDKKRPIPAECFTYDKNDILNDEDINVVVELIDDADAAFDIVKTAIEKGKAVVTANKKMIAEHFIELRSLQKKYYIPVLYEAACCASIPIIRNLEEYYDTDLLESVEGVVNGATNYILSKANEENITFNEALSEAKEKGYTESNPILDTGGFDAKYKLLILMAHAFGIVTEPEAIFNLGIDHISDFELKYAKEKDYRIKLVAIAEKNEQGKIKCLVMPKFVDKNDKLYSVDGVFNGIKTRSVFSDTQFFSGKGAGAHPTASAVLSDISALTYDYRYEYKKLRHNETLEDASGIKLKVLLRHEPDSQTRLETYFTIVNESYLNKEMGYIVGIISLDKLEEIIRDSDFSVSFVLFEIAES